MTADSPAGQLHGEFAAAPIERGKARWDRQVRVVMEPPRLLSLVIAQQVGELVTIPCPDCDGEGVAYLTPTSGFKSTCRTCEGERTVQVPAVEIEPRTCSLCRGRTQIETAQGYGVTCPSCSGRGDNQ